jgi:hypothetical protein
VYSTSGLIRVIKGIVEGAVEVTVESEKWIVESEK